jgi:hypothetical protein
MVAWPSDDLIAGAGLLRSLDIQMSDIVFIDARFRVVSAMMPHRPYVA